MPASNIPVNVIASTSGMAAATTRPARSPSETKETANTMTIASPSIRTKPLTAFFTTEDWSATRVIVMPCGNCAASVCIRSFSCLPKSSMLPLAAMEIASPIAGTPLTRNVGAGGSAGWRLMVARSVSGMKRSPMCRVIACRLSTEVRVPLTRSAMFSRSVRRLPAGTTSFCALMASLTCCKSSPIPFSLRGEKAITTCCS